MAGITKIYEDETDENVLHSQEITIAIKDNLDAILKSLPLLNLGGWYRRLGVTIYDVNAAGRDIDIGVGNSAIIFTVPSFWIPGGVGAIRIYAAGSVGTGPGADLYLNFRLTNLSNGSVYQVGPLYNADFVTRPGSTRLFNNSTLAIDGGFNYKFEAVAVNVNQLTGAQLQLHALTVTPLWN